MIARLVIAVLLALIALVRGYYMLRFGFRAMRVRKPRAWYDLLAEVGVLSVAPIGGLYVLMGEQLPGTAVDEPLMRWGGIILFGAGVYLLWASHHALAQQWTWDIGLREDHQVVRQGIYRFIRHPMYTAFGAWIIAMPFITQSLLGVFPFIGLGGLYWRASVEEELLTRTFSDEYEQYRKQTGMFLPRFRF